jgi:hypothetical protein
MTVIAAQLLPLATPFAGGHAASDGSANVFAPPLAALRWRAEAPPWGRFAQLAWLR